MCFPRPRAGSSSNLMERVARDNHIATGGRLLCVLPMNVACRSSFAMYLSPIKKVIISDNEIMPDV